MARARGSSGASLAASCVLDPTTCQVREWVWVHWMVSIAEPIVGAVQTCVLQDPDGVKISSTECLVGANPYSPRPNCSIDLLISKEKQ